MRHRPVAGGMTDHTVVGLLSLLFAVAVGISGAALSLLLQWPGLEQAGPVLRSAAHVHASLLVFFAFVPAALGGLAVAYLPAKVGSKRSVLPGLNVAALGLTIAALVPLVGLSVLPLWAAAGASALILTSAVVLTAANLIGTMLVERTVAYSELPFSAWTTLIAASLVVCAAPVMAATFTVALWHGVAPWDALPSVISPALLAVLVLTVGWVTDILQGTTRRQGPILRFLAGLIGCEVFGLFMAWAFCLENHVELALPAGIVDGTFLVLVLPFELLWAFQLIRAPKPMVTGRLPLLFSAGFAVLLPVGLLADLFGRGGHDAVSLAIVFAILAGFFQLVGQVGRRPVVVWAGQAQFWLLLIGSLTLLLPVSTGFKALGAAMSSLSIGLFVVHLGLALGSSLRAAAAEFGSTMAMGRHGA